MVRNNSYKRTKKIKRAALIHVEIIDFLITKRQAPTYVSKTDGSHVNLRPEKIHYLQRHARREEYHIITLHSKLSDKPWAQEIIYSPNPGCPEQRQYNSEARE